MKCHNCEEDTLEWTGSSIRSKSSGNKVVINSFKCKKSNSSKTETENYCIKAKTK